MLIRMLARVGLAAPEQIAALIVGCPVAEISTADAVRVRGRLDAISRRGLMSSGSWNTWYRALRDHERLLYRVTPAGRDAYMGTSRSRQRAMRAIGDASDLTLASWADERSIWFASYPHVRDERAFRARLTRVVRAGLAERRPTRQRRHITAYYLTAAGLDAAQRHDDEAGGAVAADLRELGWPKPTRIPRADQGVHHLLLVSAAATVVHTAGGRFLLLRGDEDLRSESRLDRAASSGARLGSIPDGRLWLRRSGETRARSYDLEVLIGRYTDAQISAKYENLGPETLFFSPTEELCWRVEQSGRPRPTLIV